MQCRQELLHSKKFDDAKLLALIATRREARQQTAERAKVSKDISKELRRLQREKEKSKVEKILSEFRGLSQISGIKTGNKRHLMADIADANGGLHNDRQTIANIFGAFYADLYESKQADPDTMAWLGGSTPGDIPRFSRSELVTEIRALKTGKAKDSSGIIAEMIKAGGDTLVDALQSSTAVTANLFKSSSA